MKVFLDLLLSWWPFWVAVLIVFFGLRTHKSRYWRFVVEAHQLVILTPWGGVQLAHEVFDPAYLCRWTGITVVRRIPGSVFDGWHPIYRDVFRHELRRTYR